MINLLGKEIEQQKNYLNSEAIQTIYFGGGTPSIVPAKDIAGLLQTIKTHYVISTDPEITLEANPDDITVEKLEGWKSAGINRLSIGVQSFRNEDLMFMNRSHDADTAVETIRLAGKAGFDRLTIDLIYGTPTMNDKQWESNLDMALDLNLPHLSAYSLTVEPGTALDHFIRKGKAQPVSDEKASRQFLILMDRMEAAGYEHYEISNFCQQGMYSGHNTAYWSGEKYLGIGPSAHSFNHLERKWNVSNNHVYIRSLRNGQATSETERLSTADRYNEYIMTSLRTKWGCDLGYVRNTFGISYCEHLTEAFQQTNAGMVNRTGDIITLTRKGKLFADAIASGAFISA